MNHKTDSTTKILLTIIATGVAAMTALAFEKRYLACAAKGCAVGCGDGKSMTDKIEDGLHTLKEKANEWKDKLSDDVGISS